MPVKRKVPRPFEMMWGKGEIVEEATYEGEWHVPTIQLMEYQEGEAAGSVSIRFCTYSHRGGFSRSPLMVGEADLEGLREALKQTPKLRAILKKLVG
jgi:hypothetical protein